MGSSGEPHLLRGRGVAPALSESAAGHIDAPVAHRGLDPVTSEGYRRELMPGVGPRVVFLDLGIGAAVTLAADHEQLIAEDPDREAPTRGGQRLQAGHPRSGS